MTSLVSTDFVSTRAPLGDGSPVGDADPVTTEVIRHGLNSVAEQMKIALRRTAFGPSIYELIDFCCVLYDRDIRLLSQAQALPGFLGTMGFCVEACVERAGGAEALEQGDVIFSTYGFDTGSHSSDAVVIAPVFVDGELVAYAAVKAHFEDVGAKDPYCTDTTDNFQEGTIFPGVKLYRRGELQQDLYRTIIANSRMPALLEGDLNAEVLSLNLGVAALVKLIERHGLDVFRASVESMFAHGEAAIRSFLSQIPDGRYVAHGAMDSNGLNDEPIPLEVAVDVAGTDIVIDLTNSPPEQGGPVNSPLAATVSQVRLAVLSLTVGSELLNEGHLRPIEVRTKPRTMYHPLPPAPIFLYGWSGMQAFDLVLRALGEAMPDVVPAGAGGDLCAVFFWWRRPNGEVWVDGGAHFTGQGAVPYADGASPLMHVPVSGTRNMSAETIEARSPILVRRFELAQDSAGPGRFRGGVGVGAEYELREDTLVISAVERTLTPPWGIAGGRDGVTNSVRAIFPDGSEEEVRKVTSRALPRGTRVKVRAGGGGGWGPPAERDPAAVAEDVLQGYSSEEQARSDYPHAYANEAGS